MNFTNYEKDIYNEIQKDEELNKFFINLTNHAERIISFERETINKENNVIKPSFDQLSIVISVLEREGIVKAKDGCDLYSCTHEDVYEHAPYFLIFSTLKFFGISFNAFDINHMRNYNGAEKYIQEMEGDYKEWLSSNKNIYKKLEQSQKKFEKLKTKGRIADNETSDLQHVIYRLEKAIKDSEEKKAKIDFFKERSVEKSGYVLKVHDMIEELSQEYDKYLNNKKNADLEINKIRKTIYDKVFEEIDENCMIEFDTSETEKKLFKLLILNKLRKSPFVIKNETNSNKNDVSTLEFDPAAVDWFIRFKNENFKELFNYVFDNFETSMEEITEKVLKK